MTMTVQSIVVQHARARRRAYGLRLGALVVLCVALFCVTLVFGQNTIPPADVVKILRGEDLGIANFTLERLRLPRALLGLSTGLCFGLGGVAFQTMLRNPLASPDIIGITSGASAAAVFAIVVLSMKGGEVSLLAVLCGVLVAALIYALSWRGGATGARIILIGIGVSAMLDSLISYLLTQALVWDMQEALRWLTGSVNGATLADVWPVMGALFGFGAMILYFGRDLEALRLGDSSATGLGVRCNHVRAAIVIGGVGVIAFATAATGPIAFVSFLSGPIAARVFGRGDALLIPAALIGGCLVLGADFIGQFAFHYRYPVGIVTGAMGAPFLVYLILIRHAKGGSI